MNDATVHVQVVVDSKGFVYGRWRKHRGWAILAVWAARDGELGCVYRATAEEILYQSESEPRAVPDRPAPPVGPPVAVEGFRQARFGMSEEQLCQAIRQDFPAAARRHRREGAGGCRVGVAADETRRDAVTPYGRNKTDYDVGRGKPPVHSRFKPESATGFASNLKNC